MKNKGIAVLTLFAGVLVIAATPAAASVIKVAAGDVTPNDVNACSLIDAVNAANASVTKNTTVGACVPTGTPNGGGDGYDHGNVIQLAAGIYRLTQPDNYWYGPNGLPPIATDIIIVGDPAGSVIERSDASGTPPFRLFYVGGGQSLAGYNAPNVASGKLPGPGKLALVNLTVRNGLAKGGGGTNLAGAGMGAGGAIYNQGKLRLRGVTLRDNRVFGGTQQAPGGFGGGGIGGGSTSADGGGFASAPWPNAAAAPGDFGNGGSSGGMGGVGGGGGGALDPGINGGNGGFGGGGGGSLPLNSSGGNGGFGGGGGSGSNAGKGGFGGGNGNAFAGGGGAGLGGAVFNDGGKVTVLNSTFAANIAQGGAGGNGGGVAGGGGGDGYGGALFNLNGAVTLRYATFAGNTVAGGSGGSGGIAGVGKGGAIYNLYLASPGSPAADAGTAATMTVNSSILSGSTDGNGNAVSDCESGSYASGAFIGSGGAHVTFTGGYDVVQTPGSTCSFTNNDQSADPQVSALADNGGPTETMAIADTSPAIDMGDTGTSLGPVPAIDQRSLPRDARPDVGAYEQGAQLPPPTFSSLSDMGIQIGGAADVQDFTLTGGGILGHALTLSVSSSDPSFLPASNIQFSSGCGSNTSHYHCQLTLSPPATTGKATITLTATDVYGQTGTAAFVVTVGNPPVAVSFSITAYAGQTVSGTLPATDRAGKPLKYRIATPPAHGKAKVTDAASGAFTYTPTSGYSGPDSFTFTVSDGVETSKPATVGITVNKLPSADPGSNPPGSSPNGSDGIPDHDASSGSGGGGALSLFGGLLLLGALSRRRYPKAGQH